MSHACALRRTNERTGPVLTVVIHECVFETGAWSHEKKFLDIPCRDSSFEMNELWHNARVRNTETSQVGTACN